MHTPQFIHPPDSVPGVTEDEEPGHIEAWDAVNHDDDAFVACKETVRRWIKGGLPIIADRRPALIRGEDLIAFLWARRAPKSRCAPCECYCVKCRAPRFPRLQTGEIAISAFGRPFLRGSCCACGTRMNKPLRRTLVAEVAASLAESSRRAG